MNPVSAEQAGDSRIRPLRRVAAVVGAEGGDVDADTDRRIRSSSGGAPMVPRVREAMEGAFGADFSGVRVHTGTEARELSGRIQAKAFTSGTHVWFRDGMPDVARAEGQRLVAHELTHVVQQTGSGPVRRRATTVPRGATVRRKGGGNTPRDLTSLTARSKELENEKAGLERKVLEAEGKAAKAKGLSRIGAKSTLARLRSKLDKVNKQLVTLGGEIKSLEEAEEQARIDRATKDHSALAAMRLGVLVEYVGSTPEWDENSKVSTMQRDVINEVVAFASSAGNAAPCASFTLGDVEAAVAGSGGTLSTLLARLSVYAAAAGDRRDPFEIDVRSDVTVAARIGEALDKLIAGFPRWVLAGAMKQAQLYQLIDHGLVDDVIAYSKFGANPPIFQAHGGRDFVAYLQMRLDDGVDPASFQGGPLSAYIRNFHRFEAAALQGLLVNLADTTKKRPLTLVLHSAIDHNGAFHRDPNMTAVITSPKNLTVMVEGGETLAAYKSQIGPIAKKYGNNDKIDQVMFAGHGGSRVIELAGGIEENTTRPDEYGTIAQIDKPIDLDHDMAGAQAFFDEILDNMDTSVVDPLAPPGPAQQANRRILFNACLTNSNEVRIALTGDRQTARVTIRDYIANNASLATYMGTYAKSKGADITSLGANASITQVDLIDPTTGKLDLYAPQDPKVTASKLVYLEHGTEPHGVMLAALEAWAYEPDKTYAAMRRRAKKKSGDWDLAVIEGCFELAMMFRNDDSFAADMQTISGHAHLLSEMRIENECRVAKLAAVMNYWKADRSWQGALTDRLPATTLFGKRSFTALVLAQVHAGSGFEPPAANFLVDVLLPKFDAKTARDYVDIGYLDTTGVLSAQMGRPPTQGSLTLALIGLLDTAKPQSCVLHLRGVVTPGAPAIPKLPKVDAVPEVPEGTGPRAEIPAVPVTKGRAAVDEIPTKRPAAAAIPDLPGLPHLPAVPGSRSRKETAPVAPGRPGRPERAEVPEVPEVKPFFAAKYKIGKLLAGRSTEDAVAATVAAP